MIKSGQLFFYYAESKTTVHIISSMTAKLIVIYKFNLIKSWVK